MTCLERKNHIAFNWKMKLIAAYALLVVSGKEAPTAEEVTAVVTAAGGEVDEAALASLIGDLEGKSIHELLAKGEESLKSVSGAAVSSGGKDRSFSLLYGRGAAVEHRFVVRLISPCRWRLCWW
jgi:ribosomal protein L12E/L44/L45/RPP1/RPP2